MRQLRGKSPLRELQIGCCRIRWNKLDGSFLRLTLAVLRQEHRTVIGSAKILPQGENPFDDLAFPLF